MYTVYSLTFTFLQEHASARPAAVPNVQSATLPLGGGALQRGSPLQVGGGSGHCDQGGLRTDGDHAAVRNLQEDEQVGKAGLHG